MFHSLLSKEEEEEEEDWPIVSHAVSSLSVFGSTIHSSHQQILPACLPKSRVGLFQARIQGFVWTASSGVHEVRF